jgi:hypothetical protein
MIEISIKNNKIPITNKKLYSEFFNINFISFTAVLEILKVI